MAYRHRRAACEPRGAHRAGPPRRGHRAQHGAHGSWLFDRLFHTEPSGHYRLDDSLAYVEEQGGVLLLPQAAPGSSGADGGVPRDSLVWSRGSGRFAGAAHPGGAAREGACALCARRAQGGGDALEELGRPVGYFPDAEGIHFYKGRDLAGQEFQYPPDGPALTAQRLVDSGPRAL